MIGDYVVITAAHNEEAFIERTCQSIVAQTVRPRRWIIVDDACDDNTVSIVVRYRESNPDLIELLHVRRPEGRDFRHKVGAFNQGLERARQLSYSFIGNLDADISLDSDYYARILGCFDENPRLGIAGGMVATCIDGAFISQDVSLDSVAGAVQLFRRECFEDVGGYRPLRLGGIDAAAEIIARMKQWSVKTYPELRVQENRRTDSASADPLSARVREGMRLYSLGYGFTFFVARCCRRLTAKPYIIGSIAALFGYLKSAFRGDEFVLESEVVRFLREEQRGKLLRLFRLNRCLRPG